MREEVTLRCDVETQRQPRTLILCFQNIACIDHDLLQRLLKGICMLSLIQQRRGNLITLSA